MSAPALGEAQLDALREIGNIGAVTAAAALAQMTAPRVRAADVGGNAGRTMQVAVAGGTVTVRAVGGEPLDL